jgi:hypothetical protein
VQKQCLTQGDESMTVMFWTYIVYAILCSAVTVWVGLTLKKNGPTFIGEHADMSAELVKSVTHLLIVGFYLMNFGAICFVLRMGTRATDGESAVELLSTKVGGILVVIACMHFLMLALFTKLRQGPERRYPKYPATTSALRDRISPVTD